jgi:peptidoglycan/xylan/chitin deacetylase (PgdA/CDA1 family)
MVRRTSPASTGRASAATKACGALQDETFFSMTAEGERERIKRTLDVLEKTAGRRPTGWVTPIYGWSENTMEYLIEAKLKWASDSLDTSVPHQHKTKNGEIVLIPWSDFVDNRVLRTAPQIYFDVYKETFDYLNACEPGALLNIGVHSHFGGRPLVSAMFRKVLEYVKSQKDVWLVQHHEVAEYLTDQNVGAMSYRSRFFG